MKPILFNTEMVRAILEGRKTVTRRVINPQPTYSPRDGFSYKGHAYGTDLPPTIKGAAYNLCCAAPYKIGDVLYVRETWGDYGDGTPLLYKADYPDDATTYKHDDDIHICDLPKWKPSIHMSKAAARIFLRVTSVRVERLQDIDTADDQEFFKEGTADKHSFIELWNSTVKNESQGWYGNPYVWVIEFERIEKSEAAVQKGATLNVRE
ncbi:MAG: hypothetical protein E7263_06045 [Lachnospiraceae bacterium]|nr:hypothetical protein [Lachnospiraceae bacterium]